jgi:two-component system, chemotaxis family, sensor kinase CheA
MSDLHILIVDDEPDSAEVASMILAPARITSTTAGDAYQAIDLLRANPGLFNAVLVDLAMPGMDGFGLLTALRQAAETAQLPLIAVTAYHTPELRSRALKAGFNAYFPKPLDTSVFLGTLQRMLAN